MTNLSTVKTRFLFWPNIIGHRPLSLLLTLPLPLLLLLLMMILCLTLMLLLHRHKTRVKRRSTVDALMKRRQRRRRIEKSLVQPIHGMRRKNERSGIGRHADSLVLRPNIAESSFAVVVRKRFAYQRRVAFCNCRRRRRCFVSFFLSFSSSSSSPAAASTRSSWRLVDASLMLNESKSRSDWLL